MRVYPSDATPTWDVWHVRRCCAPQDILWIDTEDAKWAQVQWSTAGPDIVVHQAARIHAFPNRRLVLIDPIRDSDMVISRVSRR